jgi:hypothetical protein
MASETLQLCQITVKVQALVTGDDGKEQKVEIEKSYNFSDGTGTNAAQCFFYDASRSLNATNEDIDLNGSASFVDFKGSALDMVQASVLLIENLDTDTGDTVTVKQPAAAGATGIFTGASDGVIVQPGGLFLWIAPGPDKAATTATTADLINVATADNSNYRIFVLGDNT